MLSVIHKPNKDGSKIYAVISSVSTLPKGMKAPEQINPNFEFTLDPMEFDDFKFQNLPDFLKDKIRTSREYQSIINPQERQVDSGSHDNEEPEMDSMPF
jgi:hypothetical protein